MLGRGQNRALLRTMMCPAVGRRGFRSARAPLPSLLVAAQGQWPMTGHWRGKKPWT